MLETYCMYTMIKIKKIAENEWNVKCDEMKDFVSILKDIIDIRDRFKQCSILSSDNIEYMIDFLNFLHTKNEMYNIFL